MCFQAIRVKGALAKFTRNQPLGRRCQDWGRGRQSRLQFRASVTSELGTSANQVVVLLQRVHPFWQFLDDVEAQKQTVL